jgi:hypothetical protein
MEFLGHDRAADHGILLDHDDAQAGAGQVGGAGEPVVAGADDGDVVGIVGHGPIVRRKCVAGQSAPRYASLA